MIPFKFQNNAPYIKAMMENRVFLFGQYLASETKKRALLITPTKYGNLHSQISIRSHGIATSITWMMPYAAYQERGMRADGTHVIKNYTTPGTGPHFAQQSVSEIKSRYGDVWQRVQLSVPAKKI